MRAYPTLITLLWAAQLPTTHSLTIKNTTPNLPPSVVPRDSNTDPGSDGPYGPYDVHLFDFDNCDPGSLVSTLHNPQTMGKDKTFALIASFQLTRDLGDEEEIRLYSDENRNDLFNSFKNGGPSKMTYPAGYCFPTQKVVGGVKKTAQIVDFTFMNEKISPYQVPVTEEPVP